MSINNGAPLEEIKGSKSLPKQNPVYVIHTHIYIYPRLGVKGQTFPPKKMHLRSLKYTVLYGLVHISVISP